MTMIALHNPRSFINFLLLCNLEELFPMQHATFHCRFYDTPSPSSCSCCSWPAVDPLGEYGGEDEDRCKDHVTRRHSNQMPWNWCLIRDENWIRDFGLKLGFRQGILFIGKFQFNPNSTGCPRKNIHLLEGNPNYKQTFFWDTWYKITTSCLLGIGLE